MNEREMEDLICAHPDEFFPRKELTFIDRQRVFPGVGRFDVLFSDRFGNQYLMELKAVTAKSGNADQLVRYHEALLQNGHNNVVLWLVATLIPKQTADFLDRYGVEHSEIHDAEYRQVAARHNYLFKSEIKQEIQSSDMTKHSGSDHRPKSTAFSFSGAQKGGSENEFLRRCDEEGRWFFSTLFDQQRRLSNKTKITWNHESGFSLQFYFPRVGFVPFVWGFPGSNLSGKPRKQRLEFPFHFASKKVPHEFINNFGTALTAVRGLNTGKKPGLDISDMSRVDLEQLLTIIFEYVAKASELSVDRISDSTHV